MLDYGVTSELFRLLVAQGEIKPAVGAAGLGNEKAGRSQIGAHPRVLADAMGGDLAPAYELRQGGTRSPIRLIVSNTTIGGRTTQMRRPVLVVVK